MFSKRNLPIVFLFVAAGLVVAFRSLGIGNTTPPTRYEKILHNVGEMLSQIHFSPKNIDDAFSREIFGKFLHSDKVDPSKNILLASDVQELKKFETSIDEEIKGGPVNFVPAAYAIYNKRLLETEQVYKDLLSKPFDFTKDEKVTFDVEKIDFPKTEADRREVWRKRLKYMVLERYSDNLDSRTKLKDTKDFVAKTDAELEKEAREKVLKIMNRSYDRLKKVTQDDQFNEFVKTITESMDPHTTFMPPIEKRYFDETMRGSFFGIGASLKEEDGSIKINTLLTGSPAWKSGQVNIGDIIMKVGEGNNEPTDLTGFFVEDAVKLIRGKKGTEVKLTMKKTDGSIKTISLIRDEIVQDETFARSAVVNTDKGKIGFIYLPEFYADFENPKGARCSEDVRKEIIKLKEQKVDGIIMDLRNNGGGSLMDVVQMVGLFIEDGPIVQVKDRDGKPQVYRDRDKSVLYEGPLAVMVNEFSASASEIFAAAIQDYNRGVIIGSSTTYGKGTVQRNIGLDRTLGMVDPNSDLGTVKLTLQKFYRINGGSTQLRGVSSDIFLPDVFEYSKLREKNNPDALPWDEIQKADYTNWRYGLNLEPIKAASSNRINSSPSFTQIRKSAEWLAKENDKSYSLQLSRYLEDQKQVKQAVKDIDSLSKLKTELKIDPLEDDVKKLSYDQGKTDRFNQWLKNLKTDIYLDEAVKVVDDMIVQDNLVYRNK